MLLFTVNLHKHPTNTSKEINYSMVNWQKKDTIIFDLDGTLVDTAPDLTHSLNHCLSLINIAPVKLSDVRPMIGHGARAMILTALELREKSFEENVIKDLHESFLDFYANNIAVDTKPFPLTMEILDHLMTANRNLGICTNKPQHLAEQLIGELKLTPYFKSIIGRDKVKNPKPHSSHLLETIKRAGGLAESSIFIGDSEVDFKTARAANIPIILLGHGYSPIPIESLEADLYYKDNMGLKNLLIKK